MQSFRDASRLIPPQTPRETEIHEGFGTIFVDGIIKALSKYGYREFSPGLYYYIQLSVDILIRLLLAVGDSFDPAAHVVSDENKEITSTANTIVVDVLSCGLRDDITNIVIR